MGWPQALYYIPSATLLRWFELLPAIGVRKLPDKVYPEPDGTTAFECSLSSIRFSIIFGDRAGLDPSHTSAKGRTAPEDKALVIDHPFRSDLEVAGKYLDRSLTASKAIRSIGWPGCRFQRVLGYLIEEHEIRNAEEQLCRALPALRFYMHSNYAGINHKLLVTTYDSHGSRAVIYFDTCIEKGEFSTVVCLDTPHNDTAKELISGISALPVRSRGRQT